MTTPATNTRPTPTRVLQGPEGLEFVVVLEQMGPTGITFALRANDPTTPCLKSIRGGSQAAHPAYAALRPGLHLVSVQDRRVAGLPFEEAVQLVKQAGRPLRLTFVPSTPLIGATFQQAGPLGITFRAPSGGHHRSARPWVQRVVGHAAALSPKLSSGMVLEAVATTAVSGVSFDRVLQQIRHAGRPLQLVFSRAQDQRPPQKKKRVTAVFLERGSLGLSFVPNKTAPGAMMLLHAIKPTTQATQHRQLQPGMALIEIGGSPVKDYQTGLELLRGAPRPLVLTFVRVGSPQPRPQPHPSVGGTAVAPAAQARPEPVSAVFAEMGSLGLRFASHNVRVARNGPSAPEQVTLQKIIPGTQAERHTALLKPGMALLAINDTEVAAKGYRQTIDLLKSCGRPVTLTFSHLAVVDLGSVDRPLPTQGHAAAQLAFTFTSVGSLGLTFAPDREGRARVQAINPGTQACQHPQLTKNLILEGVGPNSVLNMAYKDVIAVIKASPGRPLRLLFRADRETLPATSCPTQATASAAAATAAAPGHTVAELQKLEEQELQAAEQSQPRLSTNNKTRVLDLARQEESQLEQSAQAPPLVVTPKPSATLGPKPVVKNHFVARPPEPEPEPKSESQLVSETEPAAAENSIEEEREWLPADSAAQVVPANNCEIAVVHDWLASRGCAHSSAGVCLSLRTVGIDTSEWVSELASMEQDGSLAKFIAAVELHHGPTTATSVPAPAPAPPTVATSQQQPEEALTRGTDVDLPPCGVYRVVRMAAVRFDSSPVSDRVGRVAVGDELIVEEIKSCADGLCRARTAQGWVAMTNHAGVPLIVLAKSTEQKPSVDSSAKENESPASGARQSLSGERCDEEVNENGADTTSSVTHPIEITASAESVTADLAPAPSQLLGDYRVVAQCAVRVGPTLDSSPSGHVDAGKVIFITEAVCVYRSGQSSSDTTASFSASKLLYRGHCTEGWITIKPSLVVRTATPGHKDMVNHSEDIAKTIGVVAEKIFSVQRQYPNRKRLIALDLKVGGMGLVFFDGHKPLDTYIYTKLGQWTYSKSAGRVQIDLKQATVIDSKSVVSIVLFTDSPQELCESITDHATAVAKMRKQQREQALLRKPTQTSSLQQRKVFGEAGKYRVIKACRIRQDMNLQSDELGLLDPGQVVEIQDCQTLEQGVKRGRIVTADSRGKAIDGWITVRPSSLQLLTIGSSAISSNSKKSLSKRRASIAQDGVTMPDKHR
jgi:hypothetical protein